MSPLWTNVAFLQPPWYSGVAMLPLWRQLQEGSYVDEDMDICCVVSSSSLVLASLRLRE